MKPRHSKSVAKPRGSLRKSNRNTEVGKTDELDIQRGQNAEKGNTLNPRNLRDMKEPAH